MDEFNQLSSQLIKLALKTLEKKDEKNDYVQEAIVFLRQALKTPRKKWVNLKKSEMMKCYSACFTLERFNVPEFHKLIEAKLKEKNT